MTFAHLQEEKNVEIPNFNISKLKMPYLALNKAKTG
jgi:hypothetical protein